MKKQWDPHTDSYDLHGKIVVVTGGSKGIGFATVQLLAQRGATVYFTTRSESRARETKDVLLTRCPDIASRNIRWLILDLSDLESIDAAAHELSEKEEWVDILINNAAVSTSSTELVAGRWEQHMATNYIGPFLFVNRVLPLLKNALGAKDADVRIVNISSMAQIDMLPHSFKFQFDSADCYGIPVLSYPWQWRWLGKFMFGFDLIRYAVSKTAVTLFTRELQHKFDDRGVPIVSIAVHPGAVATDGVMTTNNIFMRYLARIFFLTSEQGAETSIFAATAKEVYENPEKYKGKFIVPVGKVESPNAVIEDDGQVKGLWINTTEQLNEQLVAENLRPLHTW